MFHAQSYRKFAEETLDIARVFIVSSQPPQEMTDLTPRQTISDRARDIAFFDVPQETHDDRSETFSRTITAPEATLLALPQLQGVVPSSRNTAGRSLYGLWRVPRLGHDSVRLVRRVCYR